ncbi:GDT1-like protein 1, chloroplastic, partial [Teratosphaeria destructans]
IHPYKHPSIHIYIHTNIHPYKHTSIQTYIHTNIHPYKHTSIQTYIHTNIHTYIHTYTSIHTTYLPATDYYCLLFHPFPATRSRAAAALPRPSPFVCSFAPQLTRRRTFPIRADASPNMRFRRPSPLLLLLLSGITAADLDSPRSGRLQKRDSITQDAILKLNTVQGEAVGRSKTQDQAVVAEQSPAPKPTKAYVGTEDAPVDGKDGKPHAGPYVDTTPEEEPGPGDTATKTATAKALPSLLEKLANSETKDGLKVEDIPEKIDGVMNDETRKAPKKGTTGTEGGITEKTKERLAKGNSENKPTEPKEAPPLPHSEQERIEKEQAKKEPATSMKDTKGTSEKDGKDGEAGDKKKAEGHSGGLGLEKPTDLPEKPHHMPLPDGKGGRVKSEGEPPVDGGTGSSWLQDTMPYTEGKTKPPGATAGGVTSPGPAGATNWHEWFHSFVLSLTMILFSEVGDKTFLIAALMAMRHPRILVFSSALSALVAMTVLSAVLGHAVPTLLPKRFTTFAAAILFLVFGARMLSEGLAMPKDSGVGEEMKEVEAELEEKEHTIARRTSRSNRSSSGASPLALESGRGRSASVKLPTIEPSPPSSRSPSTSKDRTAGLAAGLTNLIGLILSPAWVQTFVMTFLGEWGDRSQIATIAMAAGQDYWWVTLGAITGHACCTGLAVLGGRALAGRVSMRVVTIGGAIAFLVFGVIYIYEAVNETS